MEDRSWLAISCGKAQESGDPIILEETNGSLPVGDFSGIKWRGFGVRPLRMLVCPMQSTIFGNKLAFLIIALNPRRPYDEDYQGYIDMIMTQIIAPQLTAILLQEEVTRREVTAKQHTIAQEKLSQELSVRTLAFKDIDLKFSNFAARVQIGLAIFDKNGSPLYGNKQWESLTQLSLNCTRDDWNSVIIPEDRDYVHSMFDRVMKDGGPTNFQIRLTKPWKAPELDSFGKPQWTSTCVLCSFFKDIDESGELESIMTTLTDISDVKWAEAQLLRRTEDVEQRELMWRNFTARAPVGLCLINPDGSISFGNDQWWKMTETNVDEMSDLWGWRKFVLDEDVSKLEAMFTEALLHHVDATLEFRLKRVWDGRDLQNDVEESMATRTTILGTIRTILNEDNTTRHLVGWFTDISAQKAAQSVLRKRMDEAIEMKRQQERFIDMTSHEMRNPLSAMLHCADEIISLLERHRLAQRDKNGKTSAASLIDNLRDLELSSTSLIPSDVIDDTINAAETIIYCALHQKRIVDDILTLSRLDSEMLLITPESVQPLPLFRNSLKMFEAEMKRAAFGFDFVEEQSIKDLDVQWTLLDPSRLLQIFINLMTNAIKFTRTEAEKQITVIIGATRTKPSNKNSKTSYVPKSKKNHDHTLTKEWGNGEIIYLSVSVKDTGRGLTQQERSLLFQVFQQASPKTHINYGGSGLGLFISRQLVEMQGGQIGVSAESGKGSTFSFYIKTRKTAAPVQSETGAGIQAPPWEYTMGETYAGRISGLHHEVPTKSNLFSEEEPSSPTTTGSSIGLYVLVVEDNLVNQRVVSKQLQKSGCTVSVANHGKEALDFLRQSEFWISNRGKGKRLSVVLMDLEMPVMDGLTCVRKIREMQARGEVRSHVPVIAVTANARADQIASAREAGMDNVTIKPYRIPEMLETMKKLVSRHTVSN